MTSQEFRRQRQEIARRKELAAELVANKKLRDEEAKRTRAARQSAAFALRHQLDPARVFAPEPMLQFPFGFGGLRKTPTAYELDRLSRRVDAILNDLGR